MYISENDCYALTETRAKANKSAIAYKTICDYMKSQGYDGMELENRGGIESDIIETNTWAANVSITSSGNEPSIYAHVYDNKGNRLAWFRMLDNSPTAYGKIASYAGLYMELFNKYLYINDL